jgi:hypothetical protein
VLVLLWIALSQLRTHERCTHVLQELQAELEQRDADKQAMQKTIASLQQCDAPAGERPSEAAELLAARKTIANLQRALREVENASGVDDELAELRADAAKLRKASAEARQAERREAAAKQVRRISASAAHGAACVWRCGSAGRQRGHSEWWMHGDARAGEWLQECDAACRSWRRRSSGCGRRTRCSCSAQSSARHR